MEKMAHVSFKMTSKEDLVDQISKFLQADDDLDFLLKLAPRELAVLASQLKSSSELRRP
jgi:hypothetical protein